jgi:hypothetical protein
LRAAPSNTAETILLVRPSRLGLPTIPRTILSEFMIHLLQSLGISSKDACIFLRLRSRHEELRGSETNPTWGISCDSPRPPIIVLFFANNVKVRARYYVAAQPCLSQFAI